MNKLNKPQIWLLIITLIAGIAYFLSKPTGIITPGLLPRATDSNINNIKLDEQVPTADTSMNSSALVVSKWVTDNNVPVFFVQAPELPMVDIALTFKAGSAYIANKPGVAALANAMLPEGTINYSTEEIKQNLEDIGAELGASTGKDSAKLVLRSLSEREKLNTALTLFTDIISNANFPEKSFIRLKKQGIENLKLEQQYPEYVLSKTFYKNVYNDHPYAIPTDGTIETVAQINKDDLIDFYKQYYIKENAMIAMVGDLTPQQAKDVAERISIAIKSGEPAQKLPSVVKLDNAFSKHISFPSTQTHILIGSIGITMNDPDFFALTVGNHILGRLPLSSLLFKNIRVERGLAYSVSSSFIPMQNPGPFLINMQTRNEKADEALTVTLETLNNFINVGPTDVELELAKQNLIGGFPLDIASNSKKLGIISTIGFYNLPLDYLDTYIDNVKKVTQDDIQQAFRKNLDLNKLAIVTVGNNSTDTIDTNQSNS
jgi:zinc protease